LPLPPPEPPLESVVIGPPPDASVVVCSFSLVLAGPVVCLLPLPLLAVVPPLFSVLPPLPWAVPPLPPLPPPSSVVAVGAEGGGGGLATAAGGGGVCRCLCTATASARLISSGADEYVLASSGRSFRASL
jgi:hypothetical protein